MESAFSQDRLIGGGRMLDAPSQQAEHIMKATDSLRTLIEHHPTEATDWQTRSRHRKGQNEGGSDSDDKDGNSKFGLYSRRDMLSNDVR